MRVLVWAASSSPLLVSLLVAWLPCPLTSADSALDRGCGSRCVADSDIIAAGGAGAPIAEKDSPLECALSERWFAAADVAKGSGGFSLLQRTAAAAPKLQEEPLRAGAPAAARHLASEVSAGLRPAGAPARRPPRLPASSPSLPPPPPSRPLALLPLTPQKPAPGADGEPGGEEAEDVLPLHGSSPGSEVSARWLAKPATHLPLTVRADRLTAAKANEDVKALARDLLLPATAIMMMSFVFGSLVSQFSCTKFIPETLCTVMVAMILGAGIRNLIRWGWLSLGEFTVVDATLLNLILLPIIMFQGGWSVNLPHFLSQFPYILIFAILGTIISIVVIGMTSWLAASYGVHPMTGIRANFAFASLISATDPVATLTTFTQLHIAERQPLLNTLVFGESFINDAVAIVFFNAFNHSQEPWDELLLRVVTSLFGSMLLGLFATAALVVVMRVANLPGHTAPEVLYVFLTPYFLYSLAEALGFSGIIATLFSGIIMRVYGARHLSPAGERSADHLLEVMAKLADSGVFIICGTSTALMTSLQGFQYGLLALGLCLASRAVAVFVCTGLSNRLKRFNDHSTDDMITWKLEFMIWLSGLRGGLGLVLALEIDETWCGADNKSMILNTTFFLVCALLLLNGATTEPCLRLLNLVGPEEAEQPKSEGDQADAAGDDQGRARSRTESAGRLLDLEPSIGPLHNLLTWLLVGRNSKQ